MGDLLTDLLRALVDGRAYSLNELAGRLDVDLELVRHMLDGLVRGGYLQRVGGECTVACEHCAEAASCGSLAGASMMWVVTEKGRAAARAA